MKTILIAMLALSLTEPAWSAQPTVRLRARSARSKKLARTLPPKIEAKSSKPVPASGPANIVKLAIFPNSGNVPLGYLNAVVVSQKTLAARLYDKNSFQDYSRRARVLFPASQYLTLKMTDLDLATGWMILKSDETLPVEAPGTYPQQLPSSQAGLLGYSDGWSLNRDWEFVLEKLRSHRKIASRLPPATVIENELSRLEQYHLSKLSVPVKKLEIENFSLAPLHDGFRCSPANVKVHSQVLHQLISAANSVSCKTEGASGALGIQIDAGILDFWANRTFTYALQSQLLKELSSSQFDQHKQDSEQVENSTLVICQNSRIADNNIEVHYCTRTLRAAPNFQDTVAVYGRKSRQRFLYTIVRTGAMSEKGTKQFIESVMNTLETNP